MSDGDDRAIADVPRDGAGLAEFLEAAMDVDLDDLGNECFGVFQPLGLDPEQRASSGEAAALVCRWTAFALGQEPIRFIDAPA